MDGVEWSGDIVYIDANLSTYYPYILLMYCAVGRSLVVASEAHTCILSCETSFVQPNPSLISFRSSLPPPNHFPLPSPSRGYRAFSKCTFSLLFLSPPAIRLSHPPIPPIHSSHPTQSSLSETSTSSAVHSAFHHTQDQPTSSSPYEAGSSEPIHQALIQPSPLKHPQ